MDIIREKWTEILEHVKTEHGLSDVSFKTWIQPLTVHSVEADQITIIVPSQRVGLDYVSKKYTLAIKVAIAEITGMDCDIHFILPEQAEAPAPKKAIAPAPAVQGLNPRYTFDTFVVGKNNNFAHAASLAVAESPGEIYNPLFLYGGVGLGKTHLMHSIAHFIVKNNPDARILYVTSEEFTNEVIDAIRNANDPTSMTKFREKYRNIDVLLVDDVQFIIGKESTQEEFFHTFNALHGAGKQIILTSDRPPRDMNTLEERIKSRFEWGLMADIQSPDYETRIAILKKKQEIDGSVVSNDVIEYIAANVKSNIRELEGSLNRVFALAKLENCPIDLELAEKALSALISPNEKRVITPDQIIHIVAEHFDITTEDICGEKRSRKIAYPRQIAMYLCREMTSSNLQAIGALMGGKDHTTIMHGVKKIEEELLKPSEETLGHINTLKKKINPS